MSRAVKLTLGLAAVAAVLIGALIASYFFIWKPVSGEELFRESLTDILNNPTDKPYVSFTTESKNVKMSGEFTGSVNGNEGEMQAHVSARSSQDSVPITIEADARQFINETTVESFVRYNSISTPSEEYRDAVQAFAEPLIGKWSRSETERDTLTESSFESDGPGAGVSAIGIFVPLGEWSAEDRDSFLALVDKYNLYKADTMVQTTDFKGSPARKVVVRVTKDSFTEFDKEAAQRFKDNGYTATSQTLIDELFATGPLRAEVYIDRNQPRIKGVAMSVDFGREITDNAFDTKMAGVITSAYIEYGRPLTVEKPTDFVSAEDLGV